MVEKGGGEGGRGRGREGEREREREEKKGAELRRKGKREVHVSKREEVK